VVVITSGLGKNSEALLFIEVFFMSETQCPQVLKQFFENRETELWLSFAQSQASRFHDTVKVIEGDDKCATESALAVKNSIVKTTNTMRRTFYPAHGEEVTN
jgi:hypothetical protein